jgi:hypothetical protein
VPRLVNGLVRDLFQEDAAAYYRDLLAYEVPELETLESAFTWLDRLGAEELSDWKLADHLDQAGLGKAFEGEAAPPGANDKSASALSKRIRAQRDHVSLRAKRNSSGPVKRRPRAK